MTKQLFDPDAVRLSISLALEQVFDYEESIKRVNGFLANLPKGKLAVWKDRSVVSFYLVSEKRKKYISKSSPELIKLCRQNYLKLVLRTLELKSELTSASSSKKICDIHREFDKAKAQIDSFLERCSIGGIDIAQVVLSIKQYKWFTHRYLKKVINPEIAYSTEHNVLVRSKSERDIGNMYEALAVPYHYEEQLSVYVYPLVEQLENTLREKNQLNGYLCYRKNNKCIWKVPPEYEWINSLGSIWKTYQISTGRITMFNDFRIMLADGSFFIHEHEGMADKFLYRCNASERIFVLEFSRAIDCCPIVLTHFTG